MLAANGRFLQADLVRFRWAVPVAGIAASRDRCAAAPIVCIAPEDPATHHPLRDRQTGVHQALRAGSQRFGCAADRQTRYRDPLASCRLSVLLALEIALPRWSAQDP